MENQHYPPEQRGSPSLAVIGEPLTLPASAIPVPKSLALNSSPNEQKQRLLSLLKDLHLNEYFHCFEVSGYAEDLNIVSRMTLEDLTAIGVSHPRHRKLIKNSVLMLRWPDTLPSHWPGSLSDWLGELNMTQYETNLASFNYTSREEILTLSWEDLEDMGITKLGHKKKLLLAVDKLVRYDNQQALLQATYPPPAPHLLDDLINIGTDSLHRLSTSGGIMMRTKQPPPPPPPRGCSIHTPSVNYPMSVSMTSPTTSGRICYENMTEEQCSSPYTRRQYSMSRAFRDTGSMEKKSKNKTELLLRRCDSFQGSGEKEENETTTDAALVSALHQNLLYRAAERVRLPKMDEDLLSDVEKIRRTLQDLRQGLQTSFMNEKQDETRRSLQQP